MKSVIRKKAKGAKIEPQPEPESDAKVLDLMEALNASLQRGAKRKGTARKAASRKTPRKGATQDHPAQERLNRPRSEAAYGAPMRTLLLAIGLAVFGAACLPPAPPPTAERSPPREHAHDDHAVVPGAERDRGRR